MGIGDKTYLLRQNKALFEATLDEFSSKPFGLASTNEIIKISDYNKGSFYYRFKTKYEIYFALIDFVYTTQISLFNSLFIDIKSLDNPKTIIKLMFENLHSLRVIDIRYVNLLCTLSKESKEHKERVFEGCIESLYERLLTKIMVILKVLYTENQLVIFEKMLSGLYYSAFTDIKHEDTFTYIDGLADYLFQGLSKSSFVRVDENKPLSLDIFKGPLNYILAEDVEIDDKDYFVNLAEKIVRPKEILDDIKRKLKIPRVTLNYVLNSALKRNLKDMKHLLPLENMSFSDTSFHQLSYFQKIVLLASYYTVIGEDIIVINNLLKNVDYRDVSTLHLDVLPKLSKTSKIVIIEPSIFLSLQIYSKVYCIKRSKVLEIDVNDYKDMDETIVIKYINDSNLPVTKRLKKNNKLINEIIEKYQIIQINSFIKLKASDLS
ncbi:helix-turn-helix domain-containing protein [Mycoplasmatota bacterium WC30]